jgi:hypothetical protein
MSIGALPTSDLSLDQLCMAANREKDPVKRSQLVEEIDRRFDEEHEEHKVYSMRRSVKERAALVLQERLSVISERQLSVWLCGNVSAFWVCGEDTSPSPPAVCGMNSTRAMTA